MSGRSVTTAQDIEPTRWRVLLRLSATVHDRGEVQTLGAIGHERHPASRHCANRIDADREIELFLYLMQILPIEMGDRDSRPRASAALVTAIGAVTLFVNIYHLRLEEALHGLLLITAPMVASGVLVGAGVWLSRSAFDEAGGRRISLWTVIGTIGGIGFGYPVIPYQASHGIPTVDVPFLVVIWASIEGIAGFLIGYYDAQQRRLRNELEREREVLAARETELERQNARLEQFASVISHDLRNPLNVALGRLQLAQADLDNENIAAAATALDRMEEMIADLMALAQQGQPIDEPDRVSLSSIAEQSWDVVDSKDATLSVTGDIAFMADPTRLQQLLENLMRNAIDHGRADVDLQVGVLPNETGFYVADDGPGISADDRDKVFESGFSPDPDGTGLGLAIVKKIVDAHGWENAVIESSEGGAQFNITEIEPVKPRGSDGMRAAA